MAGLTLLATARPVFSAGAKSLTFDIPAVAAKGSLLVVVIAFDSADGYALPDGWTLLATYAGTSKVAALARLVDDNEPEQVVFALNIAAKDWLGQLLVYKAGAVNLVLEASAGVNFAADATPPTPLVVCQQAANIELRVWSTTGAIVLAAPAGFDTLDTYSSAQAAAMSLLVAAKVANASGNLAARDAAAGAAATGSGMSLVLRERAPVIPALLVDPVPGNIGFVGTDTRPPREAGLP